MDTGSMILTCLLLFQMACILILLNPVYDVRKLTQYINKSIKRYRSYYCISVVSYFISVIYFGMFIPLLHVHRLIFGHTIDRYEKIVLLSRVEKNYIIAGFSLFLVVVLYGIRALIAYTASVIEISDRRYDTLKEESIQQSSSEVKKNQLCSNNFLPSLLRVKRSISYETILFTKELREQLKNVLKNIEYQYNRSSALSSILET
ncbi:uncharacterized protein LOC126370791 [Pectinophora gossypiella]|uniref:uncharacterized protein LOC126370791 n=1 Tax=Pectinophora gossypiella TaxID=13191 RepID=UPI00214E2D06|nr:uncharacterized protein LOC126370791 [Pectinophora gossypiella]